MEAKWILRRRRGLAGETNDLDCRFSFVGPQSFLSFSCRDLLQVPRADIIRCLENVQGGETSRYESTETVMHCIL
jgi:hypothetical protein